MVIDLSFPGDLFNYIGQFMDGLLCRRW